MSEEITPIPREELDAAVGMLCRTIASLWLNAMSYRGADFAFIASRIDEPEEDVRQILHGLIDGVETKFSLRMFAAVMVALDMTIEFKSRPRAAESSIEEPSGDEVSPHGPEAGLTRKSSPTEETDV